MKTGLTETAESWKSLSTGTYLGITYSARTPSLLRPDIEHIINFSDKDAENSKINGN